jgi:hypothetical protein
MFWVFLIDSSHDEVLLSSCPQQPAVLFDLVYGRFRTLLYMPINMFCIFSSSASWRNKVLNANRSSVKALK